MPKGRVEIEFRLTDEQKELAASAYPYAVNLAGAAWKRMRESCPIGAANSLGEQTRRDYLFDEATRALLFSAYRYVDSGASFASFAYRKIQWRLITACQRWKPGHDVHMGDSDIEDFDVDAPSAEFQEWAMSLTKGMTSREKRIYKMLYLQPEMSCNEVARRTKIEPHVVRRVRDKAIAKARKNVEAA